MMDIFHASEQALKGYGKTIYLRLHDGNTAVYAHLDHFTPEVDNLVNALHEDYGKYTIDHKIDPEDYPVKKGDLIRILRRYGWCVWSPPSF